MTFTSTFVASTCLAAAFLAALPEAKVSDISLPDAQAQVHTSRQWEESRAVVLLFLGTECPVSNGFAPEMIRLAEKCAKAEVKVFGVHPDPSLTAEAAAEHAREYRLNFPVLLDPRQTLAKQTGVRITPEAVVLSPEGQVLYRGRINDWYTPEGKRRPRPTTHDLEAALDAVIAGKAPAVTETKPFGCPLPKPRQDK